jgi:hypothetical protein
LSFTSLTPSQKIGAKAVKNAKLAKLLREFILLYGGNDSFHYRVNGNKNL